MSGGCGVRRRRRALAARVLLAAEARERRLHARRLALGAEAALRAADARHAHRRAVAVGHLAAALARRPVAPAEPLADVRGLVGRRLRPHRALHATSTPGSSTCGGWAGSCADLRQNCAGIARGAPHQPHRAQLLDERLPLGEGARVAVAVLDRVRAVDVVAELQPVVPRARARTSSGRRRASGSRRRPFWRRARRTSSR